MKGLRTVKYLIQHYTAGEYCSNEIEVNRTDYWKEHENCLEYMNDHNEHLSDEEKEYGFNTYTYDEETTEFDNYIKIERRFNFLHHTVYLTQLKCKEGYNFINKKKLKKETK